MFNNKYKKSYKVVLVRTTNMCVCLFLTCTQVLKHYDHQPNNVLAHL